MIISVIVPVYKGKTYLGNIIDVLNKNKGYLDNDFNVELILINDYPEEKIVYKKSFRDTINVRIFTNEKNEGIHYSRVNGLRYANGDYIVFLDQDDRIGENFLSKLLSAIDKVDIVVCNGVLFGRKIYDCFEDMEKIEHMVDDGVNWIVSPGQCMMKRDSIPRFWSETILRHNGADDFFLWTLFLQEKKRFCYINDILYGHVYTKKNSWSNSDDMRESVREMVDALNKEGYINHEQAQKIVGNHTYELSNNSVSFEKKRAYNNLIECWMDLRDQSLALDRWLEKNNIKEVAIYGLGSLGRHLYYELKNTSVKINGIIDKKARYIEGERTITIEDLSRIYVDAVIVTPFLDKDVISLEIKRYSNVRVISLDCMIYNSAVECLL